MKRLVLHIGTEKTGTTTLQRFLHSNRQRLLGDGWTVPTSLGEPDQRRLAAICNDDSFVDAFLRRYGLADPAARAEARAKWTEHFAKEVAAATTPNMVISSEHLSSRLFTASEMDRLCRFLAPHFEAIDVVVYLREPLAAALSLLSTQVQVGDPNGTLPPPPTAWGEGNDRSWISVCDHRQTLQRWEAAFPGRLNVRIFEPDTLAEGSILSDFRSILGIAGNSGYVEPERANESLGATGIALLAALNRRFPAFVDGKPSPARRDLSDWVVRHLGSGGKLQASRSQREAYDAAFAESNEWVRATYFPDRPQLFTPVPSGDKHAAESIPDGDIEVIADLVAELWQSRAIPANQPGLLARVGRKLGSLSKG
jgi:hypothetical protein